MDLVTPTCDFCDKTHHDADWCGGCGCCTTHCRQFFDCPPAVVDVTCDHCGRVMDDVNLAEPPEFLRNVIEFDDEEVVGFAATTEQCDDGLARPVGWMLVTVRGIYYFNLHGICTRAKALNSTRTI